MRWIYDDGGRAAAGCRGTARDCVVRAVAIATEQEYDYVYRLFAAGNASERRRGPGASKRTARSGINTRSRWFKAYMHALGWRWTPTMGIGTGCRVHLTDGELPMGRLIVAVSRHYAAVIDGVIHDTHDPTRGGGRCVYGYWSHT